MKLTRKSVVGFAGIVIVLAMGVPQARAAEPQIDEQSLKALTTMSDFYAKATSMSVRVVVDAKLTPAGRPTQTSKATMDFQIKRPDRYLVKLDSDGENATSVSDGAMATTYLPQTKQYTVKPVDSAKAFETPMMGLLLNGALVSDNPLASVKKDITSATFVGTETLNGNQTQHLKLTGNEGDIDLWIDAGDQPLVRQAKVDQSRGMAAAGHPGTVIVNISFEDWKVGQPIDDAVFKFTPPDDAKKVESFGPPQPTGWKGKTTPDFELKDLDGNKVKLSDQRGKIVILDFWATWCGPCRRGMPIVDRIAKKFADQGVVLYAVNLRESADKVKAFIDKQTYKPHVLLDSDGMVANVYLVNSIPRTLVIGRDGVVLADHAGVGPDTEQVLTGEVEAAVKAQPEKKSE